MASGGRVPGPMEHSGALSESSTAQSQHLQLEAEIAAAAMQIAEGVEGKLVVDGEFGARDAGEKNSLPDIQERECEENNENDKPKVNQRNSAASPSSLASGESVLDAVSSSDRTSLSPSSSSSYFEFLRYAFSTPFARPDSTSAVPLRERVISLFQRRLNFEQMEQKYGPGVANYYVGSFYLPILYLVCFILSVASLAQDIDGKVHETSEINTLAAVSYCAAVAGESFGSPIMQFGIAFAVGLIICAFTVWLRRRMDKWAVRRDRLKRGFTAQREAHSSTVPPQDARLPQPLSQVALRVAQRSPFSVLSNLWKISTTLPSQRAAIATQSVPVTAAFGSHNPSYGSLLPVQTVPSQTATTVSSTAAGLSRGSMAASLPASAVTVSAVPIPLPVGAHIASPPLVSATMAHSPPTLLHMPQQSSMVYAADTPHSAHGVSTANANIANKALSLALVADAVSPPPPYTVAASHPHPSIAIQQPLPLTPSVAGSSASSSLCSSAAESVAIVPQDYPLSFFYTSPNDFTVMVRRLRRDHTDPVALCKYFNEILHVRVSAVTILLTSNNAKALGNYRLKLISQIAKVRLKKTTFAAKKDLKGAFKQLQSNISNKIQKISSGTLRQSPMPDHQHHKHSTQPQSRIHQLNTTESGLLTESFKGQSTPISPSPGKAKEGDNANENEKDHALRKDSESKSIHQDGLTHNTSFEVRKQFSLDSSSFHDSAEWKQLCDEEQLLMSQVVECEQLLLNDGTYCSGTAFVTFSHRSSTIRALNLFASSFLARVYYYVCCLFCCYRGPPRFDGVRLSVEHAANPSDIIWQNFSVSWWEKVFGRRLPTSFFGFMLAGIGVTAAVFATQAVTTSAVARGAISAVFAIVKLLMFFAFNRMSRYEAHKHYSSTQLSSMVKIGLTQVAFTVAVLYGVNQTDHDQIVLSDSDLKNDPLPCNWWTYAASSVMIAVGTDAILTPLMHLVRPFETMEHAYYSVVGKDLEVHLFTRPFTLLLHNRFANLIYSFFITVWFGPMFPLVYFISFLGRVACYMVDKYNLLYTDKFIPRYDERMARLTFWLISLALIAQQVFFVIIANSRTFVAFAITLLAVCLSSMAIPAFRYIRTKYFQTKHLEEQVADDTILDYRAWARWRRQIRAEEHTQQVKSQHNQPQPTTIFGVDSTQLKNGSAIGDELSWPITSRANPDSYVPPHDWQHHTVHYELPVTPKAQNQTLKQRNISALNAQAPSAKRQQKVHSALAERS